MGLPSLLPGYLTKSAILAYQTCPGFAWLKLYQPHLLPEVDAMARQRMRDGIEMDLSLVLDMPMDF